MNKLLQMVGSIFIRCGWTHGSFDLVVHRIRRSSSEYRTSTDLTNVGQIHFWVLVQLFVLQFFQGIGNVGILSNFHFRFCSYGMLAFQFDVHPTLMTVQVDMRQPRHIDKAVILSFLSMSTIFYRLRFFPGLFSSKSSLRISF